MRYLLVLIFSILIWSVTTLKAQKTLPYIVNQNLTKVQFDSVYQAIMHKNYADYHQWQQDFPQLQKQKIKKSTIRGMIWGVALGSIIGAGTNDLFSPNPFRPLNAKRTLLGATIGGFIGVSIGKFIGHRKAKNMKFHLTNY